MCANVADWRLVVSPSTRPYYIEPSFTLKARSENKKLLQNSYFHVIFSVLTAVGRSQTLVDPSQTLVEPSQTLAGPTRAEAR